MSGIRKVAPGMTLSLAALAAVGVAVSPLYAVRPDDTLPDAGRGAVLRRFAARKPSAEQADLADTAKKSGFVTRWDVTLGTPSSVRGQGLAKRLILARRRAPVIPFGATREANAVAVVSRIGGLFGIEDAAAEFEARPERTDRLGFRHVRLVQRYRRLRVLGGGLGVHFDKAGDAYEVNGRYVPEIRLDTIPRLNPDDCVVAAGKDLSARGVVRFHLAGKPELVVYALDRDPTLACEIALAYDEPKTGPGRYRYWVNAADGSIVLRIDDMKRVAAPSENGTHTNITGSILVGEGGAATNVFGWHEDGGAWYLYGKEAWWHVFNVASSGYPDNNTYAHRSSADWGAGDRAEMSAARNFELIQSYYRDVHGRNSFDHGGAMARANVHQGWHYVNAYWDGTDFHFGDGDGVDANALCVLDIAAHEFTHAVTESTADLFYYGESGALNESFSDIFGTCVEMHSEPDGRAAYPLSVAGGSDWLLGEDCWISSKALRDMRDPANIATVGDGNQLPSRYKGSYWYYGIGDNAGVHVNCAVQSHFFYLLCEGGSGTNDGIEYSLAGLGIENAEQVAYRALTVYCGPHTDYAAVRGAWVSASADLNSNWVAAVENAWSAVGVGPGQETAGTPQFDPPEGGFSGAVTVSVSTATADADIRYTTDGSEPAESSSLYSAPLALTSDTTLKAKAFKEGMLASRTASATYTELGQKLFDFPFDSSPGWTTEGQWAFGVPTGGGGEYGSPDPASGHTGGNVYGYNLSGDYAHNIAGTLWLTSGAMDLSTAAGVKLVFSRRLGVERAAYDHACIEVSGDGAGWNQVWSNPIETEVADSEWTMQALDISSFADGRPSVRVRWGMGPTDESWAYCGWNIDDVQVWGTMVGSNAPSAPSNLAAQALSGRNVRLTWDDLSNNEQGFSIERRTGTVAWAETARVGANVTVCNDTSAVPLVTYSYRVCAFNAWGTSEYSDAAQASTPAGDGDAWDPGDDTGAGATALPDPIGVEQVHGPHILSADDHYDWFTVNLSTGITYNFHTGGGSGDTYGELFGDPDGLVLKAQDDDSGGNLQFSITWTPDSSGAYYLRVRTYTPGWDSSYSLKYRLTRATGGSLGDAVDSESFRWVTGGDALWIRQMVVAHDGEDAAESGAIGNSKTTWMRTRVRGPGTVGFQWKVSSEVGWDFLRFYLDRIEQPGSISGEADWREETHAVAAGVHTLMWSYEKDGSRSRGMDHGWVDMFTSGGAVPVPDAYHDFDGDNAADPAVFDPATGAWTIRLSSGGSRVASGPASAGSIPVPGDYDGDGETDAASYEPTSGVWRITASLTGQTVLSAFGDRNAAPVPGDYDGDGKSDIAVFWPTGGSWRVQCSSGGTIARDFGRSGGAPVPGDYDGDGLCDAAVFWPADGEWSVFRSSNNVMRTQSWGWQGAAPVPGFYDGDTIEDPAVYSPGNGLWSVRCSGGGVLTNTLGGAGAAPVPADYDGDGVTDIAVYRSSSGEWQIRYSSGGSGSFTLGSSSALPTMLQYRLNRWMKLVE